MSYNTFNDSDINDDSKINISSNINNFYEKIITDIKKKKKYIFYQLNIMKKNLIL